MATTTNKALARRIAIERRITRKLIRVLIDAGFQLTADTNEEPAVRRSMNARKVFEVCTDLDDCFVAVHKPGDATGSLPRGWVRLVYGNDGWDLISDYTVNLEAILKPVNDYAETFE